MEAVKTEKAPTEVEKRSFSNSLNEKIDDLWVKHNRPAAPWRKKHPLRLAIFHSLDIPKLIQAQEDVGQGKFGLVLPVDHITLDGHPPLLAKIPKKLVDALDHNSGAVDPTQLQTIVDETLTELAYLIMSAWLNHPYLLTSYMVGSGVSASAAIGAYRVPTTDGRDMLAPLILLPRFHGVVLRSDKNKKVRDIPLVSRARALVSLFDALRYNHYVYNWYHGDLHLDNGKYLHQTQASR
eukprot:TRINITY_DN708_c0_g3_i1.p1 TRINITY_DN708_c0_g3~~TRINITY_DN708_c0_g3_i1.p1  ORF type:complete len:238 (+),score=16.32 TRINITY_DN708_c0_g3_i1:635-1348(+)